MKNTEEGFVDPGLGYASVDVGAFWNRPICGISKFVIMRNYEKLGNDKKFLKKHLIRLVRQKRAHDKNEKNVLHDSS